jgi:hypothetical protein
MIAPEPPNRKSGSSAMGGQGLGHPRRIAGRRATGETTEMGIRRQSTVTLRARLEKNMAACHAELPRADDVIVQRVTMPSADAANRGRTLRSCWEKRAVRGNAWIC